MYVQQPAGELSMSGMHGSNTLAGSRAGDSVLVVVTGLILFLGIYPSPLIRLLEHVVAGLP
jgi:hypothetical protein